MCPRRSLLVALLLVATLLAGCVETPDDPDAPEGPNASGPPEGPDGPTSPTEPEEDDGDRPNASDDDATVSRPAPVDERAVERAVLRNLDAVRADAGLQGLTRAQGLAVAASSHNREVAGGDLNVSANVSALPVLSADALRDRFARSGAEQCDRRAGDLVGQVAAAVATPTVAGVGDDPDAVAAHLADAIVSWWEGRDGPRRQLKRGFRYVGVDARHVPDRGAVLVTAALC